MNRIVQWAVVLGVWWAILVDVLGNWAGQDHAPCWIPIIQGVVAVLVIAHVVAAWRLIPLFERLALFKNLIQRKMRARLLVALHDGTHFSGILLTHDKGEKGYSTFADVKLHFPDKEPQSALGELYIRNSKIHYWQSDVSL